MLLRLLIGLDDNEQAVRQLWGGFNPSLEERHERELLVQRVRALPQDERDASSLVAVDLAEELLVQLEQVSTRGNSVRQLRDNNNHVVAKDQGERDRVQRLWTLLQGPRQGPTHPAEEGRRPDEEEETEGETRLKLQFEHRWHVARPPRCPPVHRGLQPVLVGPLLLLLQPPHQHHLGSPVPNGSESLQLHHGWLSGLFSSLLLMTSLIFGLLTTLLAVI